MTCCGLVFSEAHLLCVGSTLAGETLEHRGLVKLLTSAEFFHDTGSFEFSFEFLEGAFNVFAFLNGYFIDLPSMILSISLQYSSKRENTELVD